MPKHYADTTRNPDTMTADERRDEVAGILARGLVRALEAKHTADIGDRENLDEDGETCLELPGDQRRDPRLPSPGTAIIRQYKGRTIRVIVLDDREGFEWEGERYRTLTAIARKVTGGHINGFRFFRPTKEVRS